MNKDNVVSDEFGFAYEVAEKNPDEEYFKFLDMLQESGLTNMVGSAPYVASAFPVSRKESQKIVIRWMKSYSERHPR